MKRAVLAVVCAVLLAAAFSAQVPDSQTWNRRPPGAGDYLTVFELSGRAELSLFFEPPDPTDLRAICTAKRQAIETGIPTTERYLASLILAPKAQRDIVEIAFTHQRIGQLWAYLGRMDRAAAALEAAYGLVQQHDKDPRFRGAPADLEALIGVAHLRRGEISNCVHDHRASSCIYPIVKEARHSDPSGSRRAVEYFTRHLARRPDNLEVRWLLNVAQMTLGAHPDAVPAALRMFPASHSDKWGQSPFADVASAAGLDRVAQAGGAIVDDFDNDNLLDVIVSSVDACEPLRYFRNRGDRKFQELTDAAGLAEITGGINTVQADYNNDGWIDLFVMRGGWEFPMRNSLLRNDGGRRFTDVTREAGLLSARHRTHSAAWADFDNDGWLDLFVGHEETPSALFRNQGNGTFRDVGPAAGTTRSSFLKGSTWGDFDADGYPDLYVSNYGAENYLFNNRRNGTFAERGAELGVSRPIMSFPTWFWDYDNDGRLDLFVASYVPSLDEVVRGFLRMPRRAETMKLYRNTGAGFEDVTASAGLERVAPSMGANFGDIDNDGFLDFYLGTGAPSYAALMPNFLYRNVKGPTFDDVTTAMGTGHLQKGHGVSFGDLDNDGDLDLFSNIGGFVPGDAYQRVLFRNPGGGGNWIRLKLVGVKTNRGAIGAKIMVPLTIRRTSDVTDVQQKLRPAR